MSSQISRFYFVPETPPGQAVGNSYTELMVRCWERAGYVRSPLPRGWKLVLRAIRDRGRTACVANWIDNQLVDSTGKIRPSGLVGYLKTILKLRLICKQFVFIRHNVYPHAAKGWSRSVAKALVDLSEVVVFDRVLVHSSHYLGRSREYLPHPAYEFTETVPDGPVSDDLVYFGNFAAYKRLDTLITAWDRPSRLIVAGECRDVATLDSLKALARGKNIEFRTDWLSDDDAMRLVRSCLAMVLPHSGDDMILSGSLYFGLSCGVPVVCNQGRHARLLADEGFPGVVCIDQLDEINRLDLATLRAIDRRTIEAATRGRCGVEAIAAMIRAQDEFAVS